MIDAKDLVSSVLNDSRFPIVDSHRYWLLVTHPNNFEIMKAKNVAAMKAKRTSFALAVEPGDKVVFYLTKIGKFGGIAEFTSRARNENSKIFTEEKPGEVHPWRFDVKFEKKLSPEDYKDSEKFKDALVYLKKWPAKYWKLGYQGNVHEIGKADFETLATSLRGVK